MDRNAEAKFVKSARASGSQSESRQRRGGHRQNRKTKHQTPSKIRHLGAKSGLFSEDSPSGSIFGEMVNAHTLRSYCVVTRLRRLVRRLAEVIQSSVFVPSGQFHKLLNKGWVFHELQINVPISRTSVCRWNLLNQHTLLSSRTVSVSDLHDLHDTDTMIQIP